MSVPGFFPPPQASPLPEIQGDPAALHCHFGASECRSDREGRLRKKQERMGPSKKLVSFLGLVLREEQLCEHEGYRWQRKQIYRKYCYVYIPPISQPRNARPRIITKSFWLLKFVLEAIGLHSAWTPWDVAV